MNSIFNKTEQLWPQQWQQLAVMIDAGLSIEHSLKTLKGSHSEIDRDLLTLISLTQRGVSFADALLRVGVINATDYSILNASEKSGKLPKGLIQISERRVKWGQRIESLKASLWLPRLMLIIGAFAGVFIRVVSSNQDVVDAVLSVTRIFVLSWFLIGLSVWLIQRDSLSWLSLFWRVPLISKRSKLYKLCFEQIFFRLLVWQVSSGIAIDRAFKNMQSLLSPLSYQRKLENIAQNVGQGTRITESLDCNGLILTAQMKRTLLTGEHAGTLEKSLTHYLNLQERVLFAKADDFFKWMPRVYYLLALLAITKYMFV